MVISSWNSTFSSVAYVTCSPETPDLTSRGAVPLWPAEGISTVSSAWLCTEIDHVNPTQTLCWIMLHHNKHPPFQQSFDEMSFHLGHNFDGLCPPWWHPSAGCCLHLAVEHQNWGSRIRHIWGQTQGQARGHVGFLHGAPCPSVLGTGPEGERQKTTLCSEEKTNWRSLDLDFVAHEGKFLPIKLLFPFFTQTTSKWSLYLSTMARVYSSICSVIRSFFRCGNIARVVWNISPLANDYLLLW